MKLTREMIDERLDDVLNGITPIKGTMDKATMALFYEMRHISKADERGITPIYTLKDHDIEGYLSMRTLFIQCSSEYEAALYLLGSWRHWERLLRAPFFKKYIERWRSEMLLRQQATAVKTFATASLMGNVPAAIQLAKVAGLSDTIKQIKKNAGSGKLSEEDDFVSDILNRAGNVISINGS